MELQELVDEHKIKYGREVGFEEFFTLIAIKEERDKESAFIRHARIVYDAAIKQTMDSLVRELYTSSSQKDTKISNIDYF